jgi:hypothetical protein
MGVSVLEAVVLTQPNEGRAGAQRYLANGLLPPTIFGLEESFF